MEFEFRLSKRRMENVYNADVEITDDWEQFFGPRIESSSAEELAKKINEKLRGTNGSTLLLTNVLELNDGNISLSRTEFNEVITEVFKNR